MKSIYCSINVFAVCVALLLAAGSAKAVGKPAEGPLRFGYDVKSMRSADGKSLQLFMNVDADAHLASQEVLAVYTSLVSADGNKKIDFSPVNIAGRNRYKAIRRSKVLNKKSVSPHSSETLYPLSGIKGQETALLQESIPFERWMADGHIEVREEVYGCANCERSRSTGTVAEVGIPLFGAKDYSYDYIEPEAVAFKSYKESFDAKVNFVVARHELRRDFGDNAMELDRLDSFVSKGLNVKGTTLNEVNIEGFASPEGEFEYNRSLAERRTKVLSDYVLAKHPDIMKAKAYHAVGIGEDWDGLRKDVSSSSLTNKDEIISIIDSYPTDKEREAAIMNIDAGKTYSTLLREFYPPLRRTTFSFSYYVRAYKVDELEEIFAIKPACLSSYEMYKLAGLYVSRKDNPVPVYKKAFEQFPKDVAASLNYANALLEYDKNADEAIKVLDAVKDDSRALFPLAVAYNMKGEWEKAEKLLEQAKTHGDKRAKTFYGE